MPAPAQELILTPEAAQADGPPAPRVAMDVYERVHAWIRAWDVPGADQEARGGLPGVHGVQIELRLDGAVIGRASRVDLEPHPDAIRAAASAALRKAEAHFRREHDAFAQVRAREAAERVTVSLELSGPLVPMTSDEAADATLTLSPGLYGLVAARGARLAQAFPSTMLARGATAKAALGALVTELTDDGGVGIASADQLAEQGFRFYRFQTVHIAEPAPDLGAVFVHRGARIVRDDEINARALRRFADGLAAHLLQRRWPGVERYGLLGTYNPVAGRYDDPRIANPFEQAVVADALLRYAAWEGADPALADQAGRFATDLLRALSVVERGEFAPMAHPVTAAAVVIALSRLEAGEIAEDPELGALLGGDEPGAARPWAGWFTAGAGFAPQIPPPASGLVAYALARARAAFADGPPAALVEAAIREVFRTTDPGMLVGQMPYLGWAEAEAGADRLDAGPALRQMRELVWAHQLRAADLDEQDRDFVGGIVFTAGQARLPTVQAVRPLAFLATMLGDARLTSGSLVGGEAVAEVDHLVRSLRFLRQLACGLETTYMYRNPDRALWGVRLAPWDQAMPPDVSALTLVTLVETLASLDELAARTRLDAGAEDRP